MAQNENVACIIDHTRSCPHLQLFHAVGGTMTSWQDVSYIVFKLLMKGQSEYGRSILDSIDEDGQLMYDTFANLTGGIENQNIGY